MKCRFALLASWIFVVAATSGMAQERVDRNSTSNKSEEQIRLGTERVATTPEMWFYQQELERYDDPRDAVRRRAEYKAQQRDWRIAMMKAQGLSKLRPTQNHTPFFNTYLPTQDPYRWNNGRGVMNVYAPTESPYRR